jgi:hypothetical protein
MAAADARRHGHAHIRAFVAMAGRVAWQERLHALATAGRGASRTARALRQRHEIELALASLIAQPARPVSPALARIAALAARAVALDGALPPPGRERLRARLADALAGSNTLLPLFHLLRTAAVQEERGFAVTWTGLAEDTPHDLLIERDGSRAELVCETLSAEEGHGVHRAAWFRLADRIDPDLQEWLSAHPGRYLLKMTLPDGLKDGLKDGLNDGLDEGAAAGRDPLALLHERIRAMLAGDRRAEHDSAAVLRLDPLLLAGAQADELGLMSSLRAAFGPEAHISVVAAGGGVFAMAARAGQQNSVAGAVRRRLCALAPARLSGDRPGIIALMLDDTDPAEWRVLRETLELEGETRRFLIGPEARPVVAVSCASRLELFGLGGPAAVPEGELRFRNPAHPAAKQPGLAPAITSSV